MRKNKEEENKTDEFETFENQNVICVCFLTISMPFLKCP